MSQTAPSRDVRDLAAFGYRQRLDRTLGGFSAFAAGFSYLSILTGLPQLFYLGYAAGGPAFFWTWPAVFAGQFLVALCFAEQAARCPLSGGVYHWSRRVGPGAVGWMAGWVYLACAVVTLASVALALGATLPQIAPGARLVGALGDPAGAARNAVLLGCGLIAFSTTVNAAGVRLLARINNVGVFAEMAGAAALIVLLAMRAVRGPGVVFETQDRGAGQPLGYLGAFLAAALTPSFVMYGFDAAGSLAEETADPRRKAPRAILGALAAVGVAGALLILGALRAAPNLSDPMLGEVDGGMPAIARAALGDRLGRLLLGDVVVAIVVCTLTVHAAAVRLVFALARDNALPGAEALTRVPEASRAPTLPAVLLGAAAIAILAAHADFPQVVEVMASVAVVWANLAYLFVTAPLLVRRLRGDDPPVEGLFHLGRWGLPVNALAVLWGLSVIVNIGYPRPEVYGAPWARRYLAPTATAALLAVGAIVYGLVVRRRRAGVLEGHAAPVVAGIEGGGVR